MHRRVLLLGRLLSQRSLLMQELFPLMLGRQAQMELVMSVVDMVTLPETVQRRDRKDQ
jgi:hypothetical protein